MIAQCTLARYETDYRGRHRLHDVLSYWAARKPHAPALIHPDHEGRVTDWKALDAVSTVLAKKLLGLGIRKGDFVGTVLPFLPEHIFLEYACFKIGAVLVPLDLRLRPAEVVGALNAVRAKAFAGAPEMCEVVRKECASVERVFAFAPGWQMPGEPVSEDDYANACASVTENDGALVIFTTGSTGSPKPALLTHRNVTCQNLCLAAGFDFREGSRVLVNLPQSHVGGQAEELLTTLYEGGTAVVLDYFDAGRSLAAIRDHRVTLIGQIPAMFQFEWRHPDFATADLSSLETIVYGGQQVQAAFLEKLAQMAGRLGTGLGLTEVAGFCTYTPSDARVEEMSASLGFDAPVYPMSIREPMREDGSAGAELKNSEIGYVCFRGPQTFAGYVNDREATAKAISTDGFLYTGDLGFRDERGLHLSGRAKWLIKVAGYQVFPGDVENHIAKLEKVAACGVAGAPHRTLTEAIVAFVEVKPGAELSVEELRRHARGISSYMRPLHYVLMTAGEMPLNRAVKVDYVRLSEMAHQEIARLRAAGRWDA